MVYDYKTLEFKLKRFAVWTGWWVCPVWSLWAHTLPQHIHAAPQAACTRTGLHPWAASCQMAPRCLFSVQVSAAAQALFWCTHCLGESLLFNECPSSLQLDVVSTSANGLLCGCTSISRSDSGTVFWFPLVLLPARQCDSQGKLPRLFLSQKSELLHCGKDWFYSQFLAAPTHLLPLQFKVTDVLAPPQSGKETAAITKKTFEIKRCQLFLATVFRLQTKSASWMLNHVLLRCK